MSAYRELRLRLNLSNQRDRRLVLALDKAAENLGAPVASILRRSLETYLRARGAEMSDPSRGRDSDGQSSAESFPVTDDARVGTAEAVSASAESDPDLVDSLASIGAPPERQ